MKAHADEQALICIKIMRGIMEQLVKKQVSAHELVYK